MKQIAWEKQKTNTTQQIYCNGIKHNKKVQKG